MRLLSDKEDVDLSGIASRLASEDDDVADEYVLKLQGPFGRRAWPRGYGSSTTAEVVRDVLLTAPGFEEEWAKKAGEGKGLPQGAMDGDHVFEIECEMRYDAGERPGRDSPGSSPEAEIQDWDVVAIDGVYLANPEDISLANGLVDLTDEEKDRICEEYVENYEPPFDPPESYDD